MDNILLQQLAKQLNLTDLEPEEYILTDEEESKAIAHAIEQAKKQKAWKFAQMNLSEFEISKKLSEIIWTDQINTAEVLMIANSNKHRQAWNDKRQLEEKEFKIKQYKDLIERCTAKYVFRLMQVTSRNEFGKKLIVNEFNKHLITAICYFLSNDGKFETELNYSFGKGILIRGVAGLGKTYLLKCAEKNELNPIHILSMIEISSQVKSEGDFSISMDGNKIIYLDDVGTEEATVNHYGTKINYFKNLIEVLYLKNRFNNLIISTNNSFAEIEEKYGFRVRSRMKEMFNVIDISGNDMRK